MFQRPLKFAMLTAVSITLSGTINLPATAAGSSHEDVSYSTNRHGPSTAQLSSKAYRNGVKHRDRALKLEAKATRAKSDRSRAKGLAKAQKEYRKIIEKQGEALKFDSQNYKAANELGFALRKTGNYQKAIGAYNYALEVNPNFHPAIEYRGEAFLALGLYQQTMQAYMQLFRDDRILANQLMAAIDAWLDEKSGPLVPADARFVDWVNERKRLAKITADLSLNNTRPW